MTKLIDTGPTKALLKKIVPGLANLPSTLTSLSVLGQTFTIADLTTKLKSYEATFDAEDAAKQEADAAEQKSQEAAVEAVPFVAATKASIKAALGRKSVALAPVGIDPDKTPPPLTPAQEQARTAKALATRAARHTMGPKQKAKIKGQPPPATPAPGH